MHVYLSDYPLKAKPSPDKVRLISSTILQHNYDVSLKTLAYETAVRGRTAVLGQYKTAKLTKVNPLIEQGLVMLDFDNTKPPYYTIRDIFNDSFMQTSAAYYYRTFGDAETEHDRFRVVFALKEPLTANAEVELLYQHLHQLYPQSDQRVGQVGRMYYGSNSGYNLIGMNNRLDPQLTAERALNLGNAPAPSNPPNIVDPHSLPNYELFRQGHFDILKDRYGNTYQGKFTDESAAANYFKGLNLQEFLELPTATPFLDILHHEQNPSASVVELENGVWLYTVFSDSYDFKGDVLKLVGQLTGTDSFKVISLLVDVTNSTLTEESPLREVKKQITFFRKELLTIEFSKEYPELYQWLKRYIPEINATLDVMLDYAWEDYETGEVKFLNYLSVNTLCQKVGKALGTPVSTHKMWNILQVLTVVDLVLKLKDDGVPQKLLTDLKHSQEITGNARRSNVYELPVLNDTHMTQSQNKAHDLIQNNVTLSSLSYELISRLWGNAEADRLYAQAYAQPANPTPAVNYGNSSPKHPLPVDTQGTPLGTARLNRYSETKDAAVRRSSRVERKVVKYIQEALTQQGYITEKALIAKVARAERVRIAEMTVYYGKLRSDICNKYGLKRLRLTKELHAQFKMTAKYTSRVIIIADPALNTSPAPVAPPKIK